MKNRRDAIPILNKTRNGGVEYLITKAYAVGYFHGFNWYLTPAEAAGRSEGKYNLVNFDTGIIFRNVPGSSLFEAGCEAEDYLVNHFTDKDASAWIRCINDAFDRGFLAILDSCISSSGAHLGRIWGKSPAAYVVRTGRKLKEEWLKDGRWTF